MPTTWIDGYAFRFYSSDRPEPPHVHVLRSGGEAKVWLEPVTLAYARRYNGPEVNRVLALVQEHQGLLLKAWLTTSAAESPPTVGATAVTWNGDVLTIQLSDARSVSVDVRRVDWLAWLRSADDRTRRAFEIEEPDGFAIYWPDLDDGIEIAHLLTPTPVG